MLCTDGNNNIFCMIERFFQIWLKDKVFWKFQIRVFSFFQELFVIRTAFQTPESNIIFATVINSKECAPSAGA